MKYSRKLTITKNTNRIEEADLDVLDVEDATLTLYHTHVGKLFLHGTCNIHLRCGSGIDKISWVHLNDAQATIILHSEGCEIPWKKMPRGIVVTNCIDE